MIPRRRRRPALLVETRAIIASFAVAPTRANRRVIDRTVQILRESGAWQSLDCLWFLKARAKEDAWVNWIDPAGAKMTESASAPTFVADSHYKGGGANTIYLETGYLADAAGGKKYTRNSAEFGVGKLDAAQDANACMGGVSGSVLMLLTCRNASDECTGRVNDPTTSTMASSVSDGSGVFSLVRPSSGTKRVFQNGSQIGSDVSVASTGLPGASASIRLLGASGGTYGTAQLDMAYIGAALSTAQRAGLLAAHDYYRSNWRS